MTDENVDSIIFMAVLIVAIPFLAWSVSSMLKSDLGGFGTFKDKSIQSEKYIDVSQTNPSNVPHTVQLDDILLMIAIMDETMPEPSKIKFISGTNELILDLRKDIVPSRTSCIAQISALYGLDATKLFNIEMNSTENVWTVYPKN